MPAEPSYASAISLKPYKHGHIGGGRHQLHIGRWQTPPLVSDVPLVGINSQVFVIRPRARLQTRTGDILSHSACRIPSHSVRPAIRRLAAHSGTKFRHLLSMPLHLII